MTGYGAPQPQAGGYGTNSYGYGSPYHVAAWSVLVPADGRLPDDGGIVVTLDGDFSMASAYWIVVGGVRCLSGVPGQGEECRPNKTRTRLSFVQPPLVPGTYDVVVSWLGGSQTMPAALQALYRSRQSGLYALRSMLPPDRDCGARMIEDEQLLV